MCVCVCTTSFLLWNGRYTLHTFEIDVITHQHKPECQHCVTKVREAVLTLKKKKLYNMYTHVLITIIRVYFNKYVIPVSFPLKVNKEISSLEVYVKLTKIWRLLFFANLLSLSTNRSRLVEQINQHVNQK